MKALNCLLVLSIALLLQPTVRGNAADEGGEKKSVLARDGFDGKLTLDWKVLNPDESHYSLSRTKRALTIIPQRGRFTGFDRTYKNLFLIDCPNAAGRDFQVTVHLSAFKPIRDWDQAGLVFYDDDDHYLTWIYRMRTDRRVFTALRETKGAFWEIENFDARADLDAVWLRVAKRGFRYEFSTSLDGETFIVHGEMPWGDGAPKQVGLFALRVSPGDAADNEACFDSFEITTIPAAESDVAPRPRFVIPSENLEIPDEFKSCNANRQQIQVAIDKYKKDKGELPGWLSDLVPDYLSKAALLCPSSPRPKAPFYPDPKLPCSYTYEFSSAPVPAAWNAPGDAVVRDWKMGQLKLFGGVLPIVRCHCHASGRILNLATSGQIYWSQVSWEFLFRANYQFGDESTAESPVALVGTPAPDFEAKDLEGNAVRLADYGGKLLLLHFWATWSEESLKELRTISEIYRKRHANGLEVLGISLDRNEKRVRGIVADRQIPWRQVCSGLEWETPIVDQYQVRDIPHSILVDRQGTIRAVGVAGAKLDASIVKALGL